MILASFIVFLLGFVAIGVMSVISSRQTSQDYLLASHSVKPWLVALSAIATTNSGYMFIGMIGFTYLYGLHSIWLMIGWIFGDLITSLFVHRNLRTQTEKNHALSFAGALSRWQGGDFRVLRILGGLMTLIFLGIYAAAQLKAGSKALHVLFEWDLATGAIIGAVIVLLYCLAGGIRASIWTDAAQSFVMVIAMLLMVGIGIYTIGGPQQFITSLNNVSPDYMNWFPPDNPIGPVMGPFMFVLGWFFAGVAVIGQPHIMVRFMAMDRPESMTRVRFYYYGWYVVFYTLTIIAALAARLLLPDTANFDQELALPMLAKELLPDVLVGLVLAGLFAATMSTADSLILSCSAAVSRDLWPNKSTNVWFNKVATVAVTALALMISLYGAESVFDLVLISWSALGAAFGPLLIVFALKQRVPQPLAVVMMIGGVAAMLIWREMGLTGLIYDAFPGIMTGLIIFAIGRITGYSVKAPIKDETT